MSDFFENTYSESYRHSCEIRWLVALPLATRRKVLGLIEDARGQAVRKQLEAELIEIWTKKKSKNQ